MKSSSGPFGTGLISHDVDVCDLDTASQVAYHLLNKQEISPLSDIVKAEVVERLAQEQEGERRVIYESKSWRIDRRGRFLG